MMITLDTNLGISPSFYKLLLQLRKKYGVCGADKSGGTQAAKGTKSKKTSETENTDKTNNVNSLAIKENLDYAQLVEDLRLNLPENKFAILMMMPRSELYELMQLLGKDNLINGLRFFTKEKMLSFISHLPKSELLAMLMHLFTDKTQIIENLPAKELYSFLGSNKIDQRHFMKIFDMMPKETLAQIAGYLTGENCSKMSHEDLMEKIEPFKKYQMLNGVKKLDEKTLRSFVTTMAETFPNLYNEFSHNGLFNVSAKFARIDLIEAMTVIDDTKIMAMLTELPDKLLALTVSQIDPEVFSQILLNDHQDLLAKLILG